MKFFYRNISILIEAAEEVPVELLVSYQVWSAHWRPSYDIRVNSEEEGKETMKVCLIMILLSCQNSSNYPYYLVG